VKCYQGNTHLHVYHQYDEKQHNANMKCYAIYSSCSELRVLIVVYSDVTLQVWLLQRATADADEHRGKLVRSGE